MSMSIYSYVLKHNPQGVYDMLRKYGFSVSKDPLENVDKLKNDKYKNEPKEAIACLTHSLFNLC